MIMENFWTLILRSGLRLTWCRKMFSQSLMNFKFSETKIILNFCVVSLEINTNSWKTVESINHFSRYVHIDNDLGRKNSSGFRWIIINSCLPASSSSSLPSTQSRKSILVTIMVIHAHSMLKWEFCFPLFIVFIFIISDHRKNKRNFASEQKRARKDMKSRQ